MKYEELKPFEGKHVFLVMRGRRSVACDLLKVDKDRVCAIETNCDHWPFEYVEAPPEDVVYVLAEEDVDGRVERERHPSDPSRFKIDGRADGDDRELWYHTPADLFGELRGWLNHEDPLGRPLKKKDKKKDKAA